MQNLLRCAALDGGQVEASPFEIINVLQKEPTYDVDKVLEDVSFALVADNDATNCITGNDTEHVVVTKAKLHQVLEIIRYGGLKNASELSE